MGWKTIFHFLAEFEVEGDDGDAFQPFVKATPLTHYRQFATSGQPSSTLNPRSAIKKIRIYDGQCFLEYCHLKRHGQLFGS